MIKKAFGILTSVVFILSVTVWGWRGFKYFEPSVLPVVSSFEVSEVERDNGSLYISGSMDKERSCKFLGVTVYSMNNMKPKVLDIKFLETPTQVQTRMVGFQLWGVWEITPDTRNIKLISRHKCFTGVVSTTIYQGVI